MRKRYLFALALPVLAVTGCGTAAAMPTPHVATSAPRVLAPNPRAGCGAAATAPCPIADPGLRFTVGSYSYSASEGETAFTVTVTNTQDQTIYLGGPYDIYIDEFDSSGNLITTGELSGGSWSAASGYVAELAVHPGQSISTQFTRIGDIASVEVVSAPESYQP
jgi:hypothetical protein